MQMTGSKPKTRMQRYSVSKILMNITDETQLKYAIRVAYFFYCIKLQVLLQP